MKKTETPGNDIQTGRPIGSTIYNQKEFIKKAKAAYARFLKRGKRPSREAVARKLGISRDVLPLAAEIQRLERHQQGR